MFTNPLARNDAEPVVNLNTQHSTLHKTIHHHSSPNTHHPTKLFIITHHPSPNTHH
nr:hypothetical protein [uncultured Prevotella sp.]